MSKKKFKLKLWQKIMLGMILGIILGLFDPSIMDYKLVVLVEPIESFSVICLK